MNANEKTVAGSVAARSAQSGKDQVWADRKAAEIAAIKSALATKREAFFAA